MRRHQVQALLMGGQACVFYGATEFSRDTDLAILAEAGNLDRLRAALIELKAERIFVPPLEAEHLLRGHAVHFRCHHPEAPEMRVDLMAKMRGVAPFPELWRRRTTATDSGGETYEVMALPDLVAAKKTQRDKDWPMLRALVDIDCFRHRAQPRPGQREFWLLELRTPELLGERIRADHDLARQMIARRPLLAAALASDFAGLEAGLDEEMRREREADRAYWRPLKAELEQMRHARIGSSGPAAG